MCEKQMLAITKSEKLLWLLMILMVA